MFDDTMNMDGGRVAMVVWLASTLVGMVLGWKLSLLSMVEIASLMAVIIFIAIRRLERSWHILAFGLGLVLGMFPMALLTQIVHILLT